MNVCLCSDCLYYVSVPVFDTSDKRQIKDVGILGKDV